MFLKMIGVALCGAIINVLLKQYKPEFCLISNVCITVILLFFVMDSIKEIVDGFLYFNNISGIKTELITPILKVVGIGYITEFASDLAEESGNKSISGKIVLGGKIAICVLSLPIIKSLVEIIISLI